MNKIVDGNKSCADVAYFFSEMASIYPITPSSPMAKEVDVLGHTDKKNIFNDKVKVVEMQSEAGAAGTMHGALITGTLATTFTASQGLLLMIPNMYKMAGECLPGVIHVAARTLATHALSIFGDHSDIYATRQTGFCMLSSTNVYDAQMMASVAHLSAIRGNLPFLHFFDGFRTSHEVNKIEEINFEELRKIVPYDDINNFRKRMLNVNSKIQKGMAENEDIYFQSVEARNTLYETMPDIVNDYMEKINKFSNTDYKPFNYYGSPIATNVIVAMGSVCDTIKLVVDDLVSKGEKVGLIEVHLYRPFSSKYLFNVLPISVKNIAVLDRTKEAGSAGEPLFLDVCATLKNKDIKVVGGRYGLSSKDTTPAQILAVYQMLNSTPKDEFTIGIVDDVTNLSLDIPNYEINLQTKDIKIFGFGSDGMVSTSKDILKIIGTNTEKYVQGYNQYDSKKSGGVTVCHLRIGDKPIKAPYYVTNSDIMVVTKDKYFFKYNMVEELKDNGILVINTANDDLNAFLPNNVKDILIKKNIKLYYINAEKIANDTGIKGKISKIMEMIILHLLGVENAMEYIDKSIEKQFYAKGEEVINSNKNAIRQSINNLKEYSSLTSTPTSVEHTKKTVFDIIESRQGDNLKVSDLLDYKDGTFPCSLSKNEKRAVSGLVPKWNSEACIQCGQCAIVCPHAVIRPIISTDKTKGIPLLGKPEYNFEILVSEDDCTGCGLCVNACNGKAGHIGLEMGPYSGDNQEYVNKMFNEHVNPSDIAPKFTVKGSQLMKPCFEFSGACAGCGETPYIKLLTQLFGEELVIANATGCSSIYGGSVPNTPYSIPWANSLFEDNAEFGYGMELSYKNLRSRLENIILKDKETASEDVQELYEQWLENKDNFEITMNIKEKLSKLNISKEIKDLIDYIPARSVWTIGGDGWAYDIGFGGIDHVLSSGENVNILVLDTEVYSNTGGQASKSSHIGQVAEFASTGKKTNKKDLFRIAMSYPNCYVATVSLGSNFMQTIRAMKEAMEHKGPSIIIAYSPCVEQGIKGGMTNATSEQKLVVDCGYLTLMRYNPEEDKLYIDSREPDYDKYEELLKNEVRYSSLAKNNPEEAEQFLALNKQEAINRHNYYIKISKDLEENK